MLRRLLCAVAVALAPGLADAAQCRLVLPERSCTGGITIAAVGDILLHSALQARGYASPDGFRDIWRLAEPYLARADIAYANLEGPTAPGVTRGFAPVADPGPVLDGRVYSSYPRFNYHPRIARQLAAAGFDIVSTANNHAMDRGTLGADRTIAALNAARLPFAGTVAAGAARQFVTQIQTRAGVVAFIACSYDTNGIADPHRQVLLCYRDRAELLGLIAAAARVAAAVIVTPHWGQEYSHTPDEQQKALARAMAAAGATAIIGAHPHVIQPWVWLPSPQGRSLAIYSTGNFVSGQLQSLSTRTGLLAWLELCPSRTGLVVTGTAWLPLVMHRTPSGPWLRPAGSGSAGIEGQARALAARLLPEPTTTMDLQCTAPQGGTAPKAAL